MTEEWPKNSQHYIPVREAMKDADYRPEDSGEGSPRNYAQLEGIEDEIIAEWAKMKEEDVQLDSIH